MDIQELIDKHSPFVRKNIIPLSLGLFGLMFLGYGLISLISSSKGSSDITFEPGKESNPQSLTQETIAVDVEGAVERPGVYSLKAGSRAQEALIASGGLSSQADRSWVEKNFNLASKLIDGAKIYIPKVGEVVSSSNVTGSQMPTTGFVGSQININSASAQDLDSLPGIGPATSQKIINSRPYGSIDELVSKKAVSSKIFSQIKDKITVY